MYLIEAITSDVLYVKFANNSEMNSNLSSYKNSSIFFLYLTECLGRTND